MEPTSTHSSLEERFWKHWQARNDTQQAGKLHHDMKVQGIDKFIIIGIMIAEHQPNNTLQPGSIPLHSAAEQLVISHFDAIHSGMNTIRAVAYKKHADNAMQKQWVQSAIDNIDSTATQSLLHYWTVTNESRTAANFTSYSTE